MKLRSIGALLLVATLNLGCKAEVPAEPVVEPTMAVSAAPTEAAAPTADVADGMALPEVDPATVTGDIVSAGSSTVFPLTERLAANFKEDGYSGNLTVDSIGTGAGFERFCKAGETDIANASRAIKDEELANCKAIDRDPVEFRVGTDALVVAVSTENDFVDDLTLEELAQIYSTAVNWSDVRADWPAEPIKRFSPGTDSGTFDFFVETVFAKKKEPILGAKDIQLSEDDNVLVQGVEGGKDSIGYFGYAYFKENQGKLRAVKIAGVEPSEATAEDGSYKLGRPLYIYSTAKIMKEKPQVAAFINYFLTNVNDEIGDVGYFPASQENLDAAKQAWIDANQ